MWVTTAGWVGSFMLAVCAVPQAWHSWQEGHSNGVTSAMLWLWLGGEILTLVYVADKLDLPLIFNYTCNIFAIAVISWYKFKPRTG
jgi:uncharacterized protein with PQ loop repeat